MSNKKMMEEALEHYGPGDLITIMLSQRLDKEIVEEQRRIAECQKQAS